MRTFIWATTTIISISTCLNVSTAFVRIPPSPWTKRARSKAELNMVFDFFKKRASEGVDQVTKLADAASKGKLGAGLREAAAYTSETNVAFASGLAKSRDRLLQSMELLLTGNSENLLKELQDILIQSDLGMKTSDDIVAEVKSLQAAGQRFTSREDLLSVMRGKLIEALDTGIPGTIQFSEDKLPTVLFIMGANGMGKTTTIGKLAHRLRIEGNQTVLMAACDTFRAGAVEQLVQWSERAGCDCFVPNEKMSSPSAVLYGALEKALKENYDTLLVDTSGRLSNNDALTAELAKMKRVIEKRLSIQLDSEGKPMANKAVPHETLLVLDAAQGRMALDSAKVWNKEIGLSGLILTKLDGSARGGSVVAVSRELGLPVKLIGVGERIEDLRDFEPERFVDGLLGIGAAGGSSATSEGKKLESRLADMRKVRDIAAKTAAKTATVKTIISMPSIGGGAGEMTFTPMGDEPTLLTATTTKRGGSPGGRPVPSSSNKKKKKKGK